MKKQWKGFVLGVVVTLLVATLIGPVSAKIAKVTAELAYNDIRVTMNGKVVNFVDANGTPVEPFAINGTTYLPIRAITAALGLDVGWDQASKTVTLSNPAEAKATYITRTGSKYHYDQNCNGGTYWVVPYQTAVGMGLEPCEKCVKGETSSESEGSGADSLTMGQKNALAKAKSYLSHSAFSYSGLVKQLEYEKYSHEDAVYAVDNCGADWKEQAAKKAKSYLNHSAFSRDGLIKQLEYEGFTHEQAVYGVEQNGY